MVVLFSRAFELLDADESSLCYMEKAEAAAGGSKYPYANFNRVRLGWSRKLPQGCSPWVGALLDLAAMRGQGWQTETEQARTVGLVHDLLL